ncbi:MAG: hypothetical protein ACLR8Y_03295 [Alistipes indistinctus]
MRSILDKTDSAGGRGTFLPGHGMESTIGHETLYNPFVTEVLSSEINYKCKTIANRHHNRRSRTARIAAERIDPQAGTTERAGGNRRALAGLRPRSTRYRQVDDLPLSRGKRKQAW